MKHVLLFVTTALLAPLAALQAADTFLVENGLPRAEIVVSENAKRTTRLAAQELKDGIAKISGASLPIVNSPSAQAVHVFVGRSEHTDALKLKTDDLKDGAYRIVSGDDWLALLGEDTEFTPIEPWVKSHADYLSGRPQAEWRKLTNSLWNMPNLQMHKDRILLPGESGLSDERRMSNQKLERTLYWGFDERGSFNAVCGYLMSLGMRWYAPGEIGEVVPVLKTIPLPKVDETVRPDFPIRRFKIHLGVYGENMARWAMRLGLRDPYGIEAAHGMDTLADNAETFAAHPEWFAFYGGKRRYQRGANNHLCYSNEELIAETVRYVRT